MYIHLKLPMNGYLPILVLLSTVLIPVSAQNHEVNWACIEDNGNYTAKSFYLNNLNGLLRWVTDQASIGNFGSYSVGEGIDKVYMLYNCRGDLNGKDCHDCVKLAAQRIVNLCATVKEAIMWYMECMLHYANRPLSSLEEESPFVWDYGIENVTNSQEFSQVLAETMDGLIMQAAYDNSTRTRGYAVGEGNWSEGQKKVYCLVQCTPDILGSPCEHCLRAALRSFAGCCGTARASGMFFFPSCNIHYDSEPFVKMTSNHAPPPRQPAIANGYPSPTTSNNKKQSVVPTVAVPVVAAAMLVLLLLFGCYICRSKKEEIPRDPANQEEISISNDLSEINVPESLQFDFNAIKVATNDFASENKLGQGGFGPVYQGKLQNGLEIAVKRLSANSGQGTQEFKTEALLLVKLQHKNLVKLLGFCEEGKEHLLVYELVSNSSLDKFLFDPDKRVLLDWQTRYKIITGIARGLMYLHEDSRLTIIHRDLKCSNILLDKEMHSKISDFGTARLFGADQIQANTKRIVGTYGYMAPEYAMHGHFSIKSDVFSFGVIILEIVSGQSSSFFRSSECEHSLPRRAWTLWNDNKALSLVDISLGNFFPTEEVIKCIHIGLLCVQEEASKRPTMLKIVHALNEENSSISLPTPAPPQLLMINDMGSAQISYGSVPSPNVIDDTGSLSQGFGTFSGTTEISDLYPR